MDNGTNAVLQADPFTLRQRAFIDAYIGPACGNATEAARLAGYEGDADTLAVTGHRLLRNAKVAAEIERLYRAHCPAPEEVLARLGDQARGPGQYLRVEGCSVSVDWERMQADGKMHLLKGFRYSDKGQLIVEFYDSQRALELIGRHYRLWGSPEPSGTQVSVQVNQIDPRVLLAEWLRENVQVVDAEGHILSEEELEAIEGEALDRTALAPEQAETGAG